MISCLTVTQAGRQDKLALALADFAGQTFPERELVIVHDGGEDFHRQTVALAETAQAPTKVVQAAAGTSLGALRNISLRHAAGDYVCQWDDDDRYHPQRIARQWQALREQEAEFCFLADQLHLFAGEGRLAWDDWFQDAWPMNFIQGTLLGRKDLLPPWPDLRRGEDTPVVLQLLRSGRRIARLRDAGWTYLYVSHGANAWEAGHHAAISHAKAMDRARLLGREYLLRRRLAEYRPGLGPLAMPCGGELLRFP